MTDIIPSREKMHLLMELIEALAQASNCASGLAQYSGNPAGFLVMRDSLDLTKEGIMAIATRSSMLAPKRAN